MRIGIDARLWGEEENRGLGRYVKELILNLEKTANQDSFFIFLTKNNFDDYQPSAPNFQKRLWDVRWYTLKEQTSFQPLLRANLDLVHFPHWNVPYFFNQPFVVTIHDLILLESNRQRQATTLGHTRYALKFAGFKFILKNTLAKASKIIAISEGTKQIIQQFYPFTAPKIQTIYEGVTSLPANRAITMTDHNITKPYFLYVGSAYPHKNLEFLIKAFTEFNQKQNNAYQLVLVGREDFFYQRLKQTMNPILSSIIFWGQATDIELGALYQDATAFVTASLQEGFALPALEAMAAGLPVLASNIPCFREILGPAALYFNPKNTNNFTAQLNNLLANHDLRNQLIMAAQHQIQKFSWLKCAQETLAVYKNVL